MLHCKVGVVYKNVKNIKIEPGDSDECSRKGLDRLEENGYNVGAIEHMFYLRCVGFNHKQVEALQS
jgi:hypothetical protein